MGREKMCPLLGGSKCIEESCAWWREWDDPEHSQCAILVIANNIEAIKEEGIDVSKQEVKWRK